jgi:hypothetical protein
MPAKPGAGGKPLAGGMCPQVRMIIGLGARTSSATSPARFAAWTSPHDRVVAALPAMPPSPRAGRPALPQGIALRLGCGSFIVSNTYAHNDKI